MNSEEPKYCIALVHGTFAPDAPWTQEGSVLRTILQKRLDGPVLFSAPNWGGANSPDARRTASEDLADHLSNQFEAHPHANHFIIAHSHGGNVALMSCRVAHVAARLQGLICLATPFLSYRPRRFLPYLSLLVFSAFAWLLAGMMLAISGVLPADEPPARDGAPFMEQAHTAARTTAGNPNTLPLLLGKTFVATAQKIGTSGAMIVLSGTCLVFPWLSIHVGRRLCRRIECLQNWSAERYRMPQQVPFRLLGVFIPFDEARLWLRVLWWLAEVPFKMNTYLIGVFGLLGIGGLAWSLPKGLAAMNLDRSATAWIWCLFWGVLSVGTSVALVSAATQAVMFLCVFLRGHRLGFGWEGWTASWLGRITAQKKPPLRESEFQMLKVNADDIAQEIGGKEVFWKLRHSLLYQSPSVVRGIAEWMKGQTIPPSFRT